MLIELYIYDDELDDYKSYCQSHDMKIRVVYDCDYIIIVLLAIEALLDYATYITLGECCLDRDMLYYDIVHKELIEEELICGH